jgi:hypothetical protein
MSTTDTSHPWIEAAEIAARFIKLIDDLPGTWRTCGSVRRQKPLVSDIELVAVPASRAAFNARLDKLVLDGVIEKSIYTNGTHRWGDTYRGLDFGGMRIEIFAATTQNVGYITWLRTGPADGNTYVMQNLGGWPVRFEDGMAWYCTYENNIKAPQYKIQVPNEATLFRLIGMEPLPPQQRSLKAYQRLLKSVRPDVGFIESLKIVDDTPKHTLSLF